MKVIEKIEIKNFRSFGNRRNKTQNKNESFELSNIEHLNIISGKNDSGKSNILKALNLFFNDKIDSSNIFDFNRDYHKKKRGDDDVKEELVTIKVFFDNPENKDKDKKEKGTYLPAKFWVSRKWKKDSTFYKQDSNIVVAFRKKNGEKGEPKDTHQGSLNSSLTRFLNSIQFHYIPAIKDKEYFSFLYQELQRTLFKAKQTDILKSQKNFEKNIQKETKNLMEEFSNSLNEDKKIFAPIFELPELIEIFSSLNVKTGEINLTSRGDGIQAKLIPEILNFIAEKEKPLKRSQISQNFYRKKYFIWGFEEPENSYEYKNAEFLAKKFKTQFSHKAQIFITTHSFNFIALKGERISLYRVFRDDNIQSSLARQIIDENTDEGDVLNEELGFFTLNKHLSAEYNKLIEKNEKVENSRKELIRKIEETTKPLIITEGNNVEYIKTAKEFFQKDMKIDIISIGGANDMKNEFWYTESRKSEKQKIFFVFDCDAKKEYNKCKKTNFLIPYLFEQNKNNSSSKTHKGIENMFDDSCFDGHKENEYYKTSIPDIDKPDDTVVNLDKNKFLGFIKGIKTSKVFKNFKPFLDFVKENCEKTPFAIIEKTKQKLF